jgi:hypothetical protein
MKAGGHDGSNRHDYFQGVISSGMNRRRRERLEGKVGTFLRQYARKRQRGWDPNDRQYLRKVEQIVQRMTPEDLDELINGAGGERLLGRRRRRATDY